MPRNQPHHSYLNHNLHQILLRNHIFTINDLFQDSGEDAVLVHFEVYAVELGESDEVGTNQDTEVAALHLAFFAVAGVALVLETNPEFIHLDEVS